MAASKQTQQSDNSGQSTAEKVATLCGTPAVSLHQAMPYFWLTSAVTISPTCWPTLLVAKMTTDIVSRLAAGVARTIH